MTLSPSETPPAGWYPVPGSPNTERWWDGVSWGEQFRPTQVVWVQRTLTPANGLATAGLVMGIIAIVANVYFIPTILGLVFSTIGIGKAHRLKQAGYADTKRRRAIAGVWLSTAGILTFIASLILISFYAKSIGLPLNQNGY